MKRLEVLFLRMAMRLNHMHFAWLAKQYPANPAVAPMIRRSDERLCRYLDRLGKLRGEQQ